MEDFGLNGHKRSPSLICPKFPYSTQIWKCYIILYAIHLRNNVYDTLHFTEILLRSILGTSNKSWVRGKILKLHMDIPKKTTMCNKYNECETCQRRNSVTKKH